MTKQKPALSQRALARELGISQPMVCRYMGQGMPGDVKGARAWMGQYVNPRVKSSFDREGQVRRHRRKADEDRSMDMGDAFVNCAIFAAKHDLDRYLPILRHLLFLTSDGEFDRIKRDGEVPDTVWASIPEDEDARA